MDNPFLFRPAFIPEGMDSAGVRSLCGKLRDQAMQEAYLGHFVGPEAKVVCQQRSHGLAEMADEAAAYWQRKRSAEEAQYLASLESK